MVIGFGACLQTQTITRQKVCYNYYETSQCRMISVSPDEHRSYVQGACMAVFPWHTLTMHPCMCFGQRPFKVPLPNLLTPGMSYMSFSKLSDTATKIRVLKERVDQHIVPLAYSNLLQTVTVQPARTR